MTHTVIAITLAALLHACGGGASPPVRAGVRRTPANDAHCDDRSRPHAYEYPDQDAAEADGCGVTRVYRQVKNPSTGAMVDDEIWVFCCPAH